MMPGIAGMMAGLGPAAGGGGPAFSNVKLLLSCAGSDGSTTFTDQSVSARTLTANGNAQVDSGVQLFSENTALFDGTGDYISAPDSNDWSMPAEWTIEGWVRHTGTLGNHIYIGQGDASRLGWYFAQLGGTFRFQFGDTIPATREVNATWTPTVNTWHWLAASRNASGKLRIRSDGIMRGSATLAQTFGNNSLDLLRIGLHYNDIFGFIGNMGLWRITTGFDLYDTDSNVTVPDGPWPTS